MTPQTYAEADRYLAAIPVERRDRHRDRLYEHVAKLYQRERLRAATRILSDRDVALRDALAERVCTLTGVTQGQLMRRTRGGTYGPPSQGRRVLCLALFMAAPHLALHDVAALMGRPGRHANVIFWRDSATETERAMAEAVVNHWRAEQIGGKRADAPGGLEAARTGDSDGASPEALPSNQTGQTCPPRLPRRST